jgi:hypothetical protein
LTKGEEKMKQYQGIVTLVLKAVALGMGIVPIVLGILNAGTAETGVTLLSIGLLALALLSFQKEEQDK